MPALLHRWVIFCCSINAETNLVLCPGGAGGGTDLISCSNVTGTDTAYCCDHTNGCCDSGVGRFSVLPSNPVTSATWNQASTAYVVVATSSSSTSVSSMPTSSTGSSSASETSTSNPSSAAVSTTTGTSASSSSSAATGSASESTSGLSGSAAAGIGAGAGVGALSLGVGVFFAFRAWKRKKAAGETKSNLDHASSSSRRHEVPMDKNDYPQPYGSGYPPYDSQNQITELPVRSTPRHELAGHTIYH